MQQYRSLLGSFLLIPIIIFSACDKQQNKTEQENELWALENELIENSNPVNIEKFNEAIEVAQVNKQSWAFSPAAIVLKVAGQQMISNLYTISVRTTSNTEVPTAVKAIIEKKDITDDSLYAQYLYMELKLYGSIWKIEKVRESFICRRNGDTNSLTAEKCL